MKPYPTAIEIMYDRFNEQDINGVLAMLAADVKWANGMDGDYVHGHEELRAYWLRQWSMVRPHVQPMRFNERSDGSVRVEVRQTVRDLEGKPLQDQAHGLYDMVVHHMFRIVGGKVTRFDIEEGPAQ